MELLQCGNGSLYSRLRKLVDEATAVNTGRGVTGCWDTIVQGATLRHDRLEGPADRDILQTEEWLTVVNVLGIEAPVVRDLNMKLGKEMMQLASSLDVVRKKKPIGSQYNRPPVQMVQVFG